MCIALFVWKREFGGFEEVGFGLRNRQIQLGALPENESKDFSA